MNSKRGLMTMLVGLAMLATPIAANAKDRHGQRYANPAVVARRDVRNGAAFTPAPAAFARHDWHHGRNDGYAGGYQGYGYRGYSAPVYAAPVYGAPGYQGYGGGAGCGAAQRVMSVYARDRATGHPAAAYDVLRQNQWAMHSGCGAGAPYGGGLLGGLGGLGGYRGAPAYNNYGGGGLLGGLGGYRGAPAYGNGGYNAGYGQPSGYGQPYGGGSMLAPLLQYIH